MKVTKLTELDDARCPNNIETGFETIQEVNKDRFQKPEVDKRFWVGGFTTSVVREIIDDNTFRTFNSIYRWETFE